MKMYSVRQKWELNTGLSSFKACATKGESQGQMLGQPLGFARDYAWRKANVPGAHESRQVDHGVPGLETHVLPQTCVK